MDGLKLRIQHPDGRREELFIESDQVLIGSGAHCDIRLPLDQARVEHVLVRASPAGLHATARALEPAPTLNGVEFVEAPVLENATLGIGNVRIEIDAVMLSATAAAVQAKKDAPRPIVYLVALAGIAAAGMMLLGGRRGGVATTEPAVPELWAGGDVSTCPEAGSQALALAQVKVTAADAKRERAPFRPQDGVAAVSLYQTAAACYRAGGDPATATDVTGEWQALKRQVVLEFRTHRVRLQHAFTTQDWKTAQREVKTLLAYTDGLKGDYTTWLSNWDRKLESQFGGKKS